MVQKTFNIQTGKLLKRKKTVSQSHCHRFRCAPGALDFFFADTQTRRCNVIPRFLPSFICIYRETLQFAQHFTHLPLSVFRVTSMCAIHLPSNPLNLQETKSIKTHPFLLCIDDRRVWQRRNNNAEKVNNTAACG